MKFRDSGMPDEQTWNTFFDPMSILGQMEITPDIKTLIDIGCGYGTFIIPASGIAGQIVGVDIESKMIDACAEKLNDYGIKNIELVCGDISTVATLNFLDKYKGNVDYITLFNILHCERPHDLLNNAYDLLNVNGKIGIIHWINGETPRGPAMEIRPRPETIIGWAEKTGLTLIKEINLPPYHFGLIFKK